MSSSNSRERILKNVQFPFTPYDCQVTYMDHVIKALETKQNALLESPTGTGKTLCLLCASLSWQQQQKMLRRQYMPTQPGLAVPSAALQYSNLNTNSNLSQSASVPIILYASRTHTQISQVISELKSTSYKPNMIALGSRDQLCINTHLNTKYSGSMLNNKCSALCSARKCIYRNNLDKGYRGMVEGVTVKNSNDTANTTSSCRTPMLDIEELVSIGKRDNICSYFYSKEQLKTAELVLLPYNYLLDPNIRATVKIDWKNAVVIVDEAHNLEKVACDAASVTITSENIASIIKELQETIGLIRKQPQSSSGVESTANVVNAVMGKTKKDSSPSSQQIPNLHVVMNILQALFEFENRVDQLGLQKSEAFGGATSLPSTVLPGKWITETLDSCGFQFSSIHVMIAELKRTYDFLINEKSVLLGEQEAALGMSLGGGGGAALQSEPKISSLILLLSRAFRGKTLKECIEKGVDYKVYVSEERKKTYTSAAPDSRNQASSKQIGKSRKLCYWAFSPGIALEDLKKLGVASILLTSGTLSPLGAFQHDMRIPFPIQLENPHIISEKQMWIGSISSGLNGKSLVSNYQHRDTTEYQESLGHSILHILNIAANNSTLLPVHAQTEKKMLNDIASSFLGIGSTSRTAPLTAPAPRTGSELVGGILIFFQSYDVMENITQRWKDWGLYSKLEAVGGDIIMEPRGGNSSNNGANNYWKPASKAPSNYNTHAHSTGRGYSNNHSNMNRSQNQNGFSGMFASGADNSMKEEELELKDVVKRLDRVLSTKKRCIIMAVFQGKISEGIDFKDSRGRVIIVTGIPYAPMKDPWVVLKKQYLDERKMNKAGGSSGLSGSSWYMQSAGRAVNQALGRIIRHNKDWGAIFLLDERFCSKGQSDQLSKWIRPRVKVHDKFIPGVNQFRAFLTNAMSDPDLNPSKPVPASKPVRPGHTVLKYDVPVSGDHSQTQGLGVQKTVEVAADNVETGAGFINPSLLLSQQQSFGLPAPATSTSADSQLNHPPAVKPQPTVNASANNGYIPNTHATPAAPSVTMLKETVITKGNAPNGMSLSGTGVGLGLGSAAEVVITPSTIPTDEKRGIIRSIKEELLSVVTSDMNQRFHDALSEVKQHKFASAAKVKLFVDSIMSAFNPHPQPVHGIGAGSISLSLPSAPVIYTSVNCAVEYELLLKILQKLGCLIPASLSTEYVKLISGILRSVRVSSAGKRKHGDSKSLSSNGSIGVLYPPKPPRSKTNADSVSASTASGAGRRVPSQSCSHNTSVSELLSQYSQNPGESQSQMQLQLSQSKRVSQAAAADAKNTPAVSAGTGTGVKPEGPVNAAGNAGIGSNGKTGTGTGSISKTNAPPASRSVQSQGTGVAWQPSKRAKLLAASAASTPTYTTTPAATGKQALKPAAQDRPDDLSQSPGDFLSQVNSIEFRNLRTKATGNNGANKVSAPLVPNPKRLECCICTEPATTPCASKQCGHIACESCWKRWFNSKSAGGASCPVCRKAASIETLTKVSIKQ